MSYQHFSSMGSDPIDVDESVVRMECPRDGGGEAAATARGVGNMV